MFQSLTRPHRRSAAPSSMCGTNIEGIPMKAVIAWPVVALMLLGGSFGVLAGDLKDEVKIEIESTEVHSGMEPGMYVCAAGHLHIKGTVQNLTGVPMGPIKVAGKVFDADGKVLGTGPHETTGAEPQRQGRDQSGIPHGHRTTDQAGEDPGACGCRGGV